MRGDPRHRQTWLREGKREQGRFDSKPEEKGRRRGAEKDHGNTKSAGRMGQKPFARTFPTEEELESRADEPLAAFERKEHVVREKMVEVESVKVRARW